MTRAVTIKFRNAGKQYDFNARDFELIAGDRVIVETDRGRALGTVVSAPVELETSNEKRELKNVTRLATEEDLQLAVTNAAREETALIYCRSKVIERNMEMKMVKAEYLFDGSKIIFYFTADGRVDFRELVKDLAHYFHTRIEMRQIGVRDEAKLIGGIGICGLSLCCCTFLTEFTPVSVKMAKEQNLALNPNKISGQCGRLLCCLSYEYETYCRMRKGMPKTGLKLTVEGINAYVAETDILGQKVTVRIADGRSVKMTRDEFKLLQESGGKLPEQKPQIDLEALPIVTPKPEKSKAAKADESNQEPEKKKRRRRRRKPEGSNDQTADQQQNNKSESTGQKESAGQNRPKNRDQQPVKPPHQGETPPSDTQKKKRRRRRRRSGPKPESTDKT